MVEKVRQQPSELAVHVALLQLQTQYWMHYEMAPKAHKDHIGTRNGHPCLHQTYHYLFLALRDLLLQVNPPPLRPPAPAASAGQGQEPQFQGIYLGEDLGRASVP
jgi:hypothetical protein